MRGGVFPAELPESEAMERVMAEPPMDGRDLAREVTPAEPVVLEPLGGTERRPARGGASTPGSRTRSCATCASAACGSSCTRARDRRAILAREPDAVFLANGPGDPAALDYVVDTVRELVGKVPVLGICLGHQLLCRAVGPRDLQAALRPPRRQPPGEGPRDGADRHHLPEPRLRGARPGRRSARSTATSRCAGRPTSARPSSRS